MQLRLKLKRTNVKLLLLYTICTLFAWYGASKGTNRFGVIALILSLYYMFTNSPEENFDFLVAMIPYQYCWLISGTSLRGVMCLIPTAMLPLKKRNGKAPFGCVLGTFMLIFSEVLNDMFHTGIPSFINTICPILYLGFFSIMIGSDTSNWDIIKMMKIFIISSTIACFANLLVGGGLSAYNNDIPWYRFGQESAETYLPGAMELPLFSSISILIIISLFSYYHLDNCYKRIFWGGLLGIHLLFGILTVSRVFILCMTVVFLLLFIWMIRYSNFTQLAKIIMFIFIVILFAMIFYYDLIALLINKMVDRLFITNSDVAHGRSFIWIDCIKYLFYNIKALLIGEGIEYYSVLGMQNGYYFSMMAHNFYLDVLMGTGVVGALSLIAMYKNIIRPDNKRNTLSYGILAIIIFAFCVSGSLNYTRNYIYIMMGIIFMNNFKDQIENRGFKRIA